jgi:hypothetical protein
MPDNRIPWEVIRSLMRLDIKKLESQTFRIKLEHADDGFTYAYCEHGWIAGPKERLGSWR